MKTLPAAILAALILSGCSSATLQFASDPEGAVVRTSGNGSVLGTTPFSVSVDPDSLARYATSPGCYRLPYGYDFIWESGAKVSTASPLDMCSMTSGKNQVFRFSFSRPKDAPGLETDLRVALKNAQERARREAERAAQLENEQLMMDMGWRLGLGLGTDVYGTRTEIPSAAASASPASPPLGSRKKLSGLTPESLFCFLSFLFSSG